MQRIHIETTIAAERTQYYLSVHGFDSFILSSGCKYESGKILEAKEDAIKLAQSYLDFMGAKYSQEH